MKNIFITLHDFVQNAGQLESSTIMYKKNDKGGFYMLGKYEDVYRTNSNTTYFIKLEYMDFSIADIIKRAKALKIEQ